MRDRPSTRDPFISILTTCSWHATRQGITSSMTTTASPFLPPSGLRTPTTSVHTQCRPLRNIFRTLCRTPLWLRSREAWLSHLLRPSCTTCFFDRQRGAGLCTLPSSFGTFQDPLQSPIRSFHRDLLSCSPDPHSRAPCWCSAGRQPIFSSPSSSAKNP